MEFTTRMVTDQLPAHTLDMVTYQRSLDYMRFLSCLHAEDGRELSAVRMFAARWPLAQSREFLTKAFVAPGMATDAAWAGPLAPIMPLSDAFLAYARPLSLVGKIPGLRKVPLNVSVAAQTAVGVYSWVGEGVSKPVTKGGFATVTLAIAKASGIILVTDELLKLISPGSEVALRQELAAGIGQFLDQQFVDPTVAVGSANPASITNGVTPIAPTGTTAAALVKDVGALIGQFVTNNPDTTSSVLLMTPAIATMLVGATNSLTLTVNGGSYSGIPVVVSGNVGTRIVALDASAILFADAGVTIDASKHATIQADSTPDNPVVAGTIETSLWQNNLVGLKAERFVNWKKSRATAVSLVSPTAYVPGT
jgi:HK97 family phage major capsid protein